MKLKMIQAGYENFTGDFGTVDFVDGVSVDDVAPIIAQRLANAIQIETVDGTNPSSSQLYLDTRALPMNGEMTTEVAGGQILSAGVAIAPIKVWTQDELNALADAGGIAAIRKIAEPMGLKSTKVVELVAKILEAQKPKAVEPVLTPPAPAPVVEETVVVTEPAPAGPVVDLTKVADLAAPAVEVVAPPAAPEAPAVVETPPAE